MIATFRLGQFLEFGQLKTFKAPLEDRSSQQLSHAMEREPQSFISILKVKMWRSLLWWKSEPEKDGSSATLKSSWDHRQNFSVFLARAVSITQPFGKFMNNIFAQVLVSDILDVLPLILTSSSLRNKVFLWCLIQSLILQDYLCYMKSAP